MSAGSERVALVTGATGAIGKAIAEGLARRGLEVVIACRDAERGKAALAAVSRASTGRAPRLEIVDASLQASVRALAERWTGPLHVLVNNAAECPRQREVTKEGIERQFATNVLGYFWLTRALTDVMQRSAPARVVNVASYWAGGLDLDDLEFLRRRYDNDAAYRQSKQANRMLSLAFAERLAPLGIVVNACHPGDVNSRLSNSLGFGGHESPDEGAETPLWLAVDPAAADVTGKYFEHCNERPCSFSADRAAVEALFERCARY